MIIIYILIACFIAWIWIDYFRLIGVYGKKNLKDIIITFLLGAASTQIVIALHRYGIMNLIPLELNGDMVNDFLYCIVKIGLVEEFSKMVPFIIMYLFFRSAFKQPIDYIAIAAISALGFAAAENIMYFTNHNGEVISARAILTSVGHMFYSALIGYGIVLVKYRNIKPAYKIFIVPAFALLAIFSHAFYDFWIITGQGAPSSWISILFFLLTVSWYATILNNALNNSSEFSYKKTVNSDMVMTRILTYYAIVFVLQFVVNAYVKNVSDATIYLFKTVRGSLIIISAVAARLSRFTLIQDRWEPIKLELPFKYASGGAGLFGIAIKGSSFKEENLNKYYEEYFTINPVARNVSSSPPRIAYIEKKMFLKNDESLNITRVYKDETRQSYDLFLLKPKTKDKVFFKDKYPIASLLRYKDLDGMDLSTLTVSDFGFIEWVYIKPLEAEIAPANSLEGVLLPQS